MGIRLCESCGIRAGKNRASGAFVCNECVEIEDVLCTSCGMFIAGEDGLCDQCGSKDGGGE